MLSSRDLNAVGNERTPMRLVHGAIVNDPMRGHSRLTTEPLTMAMVMQNTISIWIGHNHFQLNKLRKISIWQRNEFGLRVQCTGSRSHSLSTPIQKSNATREKNAIIFRLFSRRLRVACPTIHLLLFARLNSYCFEYEILFCFFVKKKSIFCCCVYAAAFRTVYFHLGPFNLKLLLSNNNTRQHMRIIYAHANQSEVEANSGSFVYIC